MTWVSPVFAGAAAVLWLISAWCWAASASIKVRDNIDEFINDLHDAGWWNARAAWAAFGAAVCCVAVEVLRAVS
jgi:hypothetical protein